MPIFIRGGGASLQKPIVKVNNIYKSMTSEELEENLPDKIAGLICRFESNENVTYYLFE